MTHCDSFRVLHYGKQMLHNNDRILVYSLSILINISTISWLDYVCLTCFVCASQCNLMWG